MIYRGKIENRQTFYDSDLDIEIGFPDVNKEQGEELARAEFERVRNLSIPTEEAKRKQKLINQVKQKAKELLSSTDYKAQRHEEQLKIGAETDLTDIEYKAFLTERNEIRKKSNKFESEIEKLETLEELKNYKIEY
ncbi:hypothetical protein KC717_06795 [Candidatus Dojkabacteria bacterium]|uniref:Uncharacterized protein n=1 Tax=Candidatus Dojkabacteria bacterium TaxID=2099670 RepID=A0A955LA26_9BACT|nr:hypothetical protein [Candidatus Dojkabacteria bacterium]